MLTQHPDASQLQQQRLHLVDRTMQRLALSLLSFSRLIPSLTCLTVIQYHTPTRPVHLSSFATKLTSHNSLFDMTSTDSIGGFRSTSDTTADNDAQMEETLFGLFGCVADKPDIQNALNVLQSVLAAPAAAVSTDDTEMEVEQNSTAEPNQNAERRFAQHAILVAESMCDIVNDMNLHKKERWQALQKRAEFLQSDVSEANALAVSMVFGALSLFPPETATTAGSNSNNNKKSKNKNNQNDEAQSGPKAAASAMSSTTSRNKNFRHKGRIIANNVLKSFLVHSSCSDTINLTILTHFAKAFKINHEQDPQYSELAANAIRYSLRHDLVEDGSTATTILVDPANDASEDVKKQRVSSALALACQMGPWPMLSPVPLIDIAIELDYWHTAEQVCISAYKAASSNVQVPIAGAIQYNQQERLEEVLKATEALIETAMDARLFRLADNMATKLYEQGGRSKYVEARLYHAFDTITKVVYKRQLPIIERQVDRVDKAVEKLKSDMAKESNDEQVVLDEQQVLLLSDETDSARKQIRRFALNKLTEAGEGVAAHRLASLWSMDYVYDEEAILVAAAERRKRYLQWDECLAGAGIPNLLSEPQELRTAFDRIRNDAVFGIDAEWDEETIGAGLFQFSGRNEVLLIDIPALSSTEEGVKALSETVGALMNSSEATVVGFSPRQDLSRLRVSKCVSTNHWLSGTRAVVDAQRIAGEKEPKLRKLGLARVSQHYLGKPLDKAEQCSMWSSRPLSESQRIYAALDAWTCVAIYEKIYPKRQ
ncbi:unnamed protein product [Cylindrotheca closterium]|uniref:3'-5' exonuclease domain-containing protein n=1 Tax=Cylindrotheca closterium TaxID=2856 RepID=A0AAD2CUP7_9STRA|nr:unnamed protein product [Cylindrotheca closterium]